MSKKNDANNKNRKAGTLDSPALARRNQVSNIDSIGVSAMKANCYSTNRGIQRQKRDISHKLGRVV